VATLDEIAPPAEPPVNDPGWTESTRLMCAAAYLHNTFAQDVIEEIVEEPYRAVQVPAGVDVVPVVKHCLAAQRQKALRDMVLMGIFVVAILLLVVTGNPVFIVLGALLGWLTVLTDLWTSTFGIVGKNLTASTFDPDAAPAIADATTAARVDDIARRQAGNLVVYAGFNPFSSAGVDLDGWSFVTDLRRGADRLGQRTTPTDVDPSEMYEAVTAALNRFQVAGYSVEDRLYVHGTDIRDDRALLPEVLGRPAFTVGPEVMQGYVEHPTHRVRHYRRFQVVDWRGELVVTLFLRFSINNGRLFTELSRFVLLPVKQEYRRIDGIDQELTLRQLTSILGRSVATTFGLGIRSFGTAARPWLHMRRQAEREREVKRNHFYDYGARPTALDRARSGSYTRYFQMLDRQMHVKLLERGLLDAIVEHLDAHGVDTSDLAQRREQIINHGMIVTGGTVNQHNTAVGQNAGIIDRLRGTAQDTSSTKNAS
jgi:hypothetical protein